MTLERNTSRDASPAAAAATVLGGGSLPDGATILLVEDDARVRYLLRGRLEAAGYAVVEAGDGDEALARFRENPVEVVITDILLPRKDGCQFITELLDECPGVSVVAISGALDRNVRALLAEASRRGAIGTLKKPFTSEQLIDAVRSALRERRLASESDAWRRPA